MNYRAIDQPTGPFGLSLDTWLLVSSGLYLLTGSVGIGSLILLKRVDGLPKEK